MVNLQRGKKVGEIFETKDYSIFRFRSDNRLIRQNKVTGLSKRMKVKGWLSTSVVTINGKGEVIDGQHRVKAAMETNTPVRYKISKGAGVEEMTDMNTLQSNWSPFDHLHKFVVRGNENYVTFDKFANDYPMFKYTEIAMFLNNSMTSVKREKFESGEWTIKNETKGRQWADYILQLKPYGEKFYNRAIFVRALVKILSNKTEFKFEEFLHKVRLRPMNFVQCGTVDQYIEMIEGIYNYRRSDKVNLRF
jgi:hypothetical protein